MTHLPLGYTIQLRPETTRLQGGRFLLGGSPRKMLRLTPTAQQHIAQDQLTVRDHNTAKLARHLMDADAAVPVREQLAPAGPDELTVVIPVKDRDRGLVRTLEALDANTQVIVVDDGSKNPAQIARTAERFGARLLVMPRNRGPAAARNAGLDATTTKLVAFIDSDVTVTTQQLTELTKHFADPSLAVVAPRVRAHHLADTPSWHQRYDAIASSLDLGARGGLVGHKATVAWLPAACLVAQTETLQNGFDESMRVGEDVDLIWRLIRNGKRVRYDPSIVALHESRETTSRWLGRKVVYGSSAARLAQKHPGAVAPAVLAPLPAAAALALLALRPIPAITVSALLTCAARKHLARQLPTPQPATRLALESLGWHLRQESSLLLRHWWPLTAIALAHSTPARRLATRAIIADALVTLITKPGTTLTDATLARRLDDLAYGTGVWISCFKHASPAALIPRLQVKSSDRRNREREGRPSIETRENLTNVC